MADQFPPAAPTWHGSEAGMPAPPGWPAPEPRGLRPTRQRGLALVIAGVLAMAVRSIGFISTVSAEAIADVQPGQIEAIRAAGGTQFKVLWSRIVTQLLTLMLGTVIIEWNIARRINHIRAATVA